MKEFLRRIQSFVIFFLSALFLVVLTHRAFADEMSSHPENRIGYMDEAVVRSRVEQLGYEQPSNISLPVESELLPHPYNQYGSRDENSFH
ncbi:MAG: hypothetical protein AAFW84_26100, partial [Cyanobacteria bacterium J06635_15]